MKKALAVILIISLTTLSCSSLNRKKDYARSSEYLNNADVTGAAESLPVREGHTFITIMEKTYLNLLAGNSDIDDLKSYAEKIDSQIRYKISRGAKSFFFVETPEGYYASEHEIIWMHFLLSWGYSLKKDFSSARVEVKKSSILLSNKFSEEGRFDDALMRIMCASLWTMCGEWEEARVDFRRAWVLNRSLKWAKKLAEKDNAPTNLFLIMGGTGYEPSWRTRSDSFIRGFRNVEFKGSGNKSRIAIKSTGKITEVLHITPDASNWYERHKTRNSEISYTIDDTKYAEKFGLSSTKLTGKVALGIAGGIAIFAVLGGLGLSIAVLGLYAESSEVVGAGISVFVFGAYKGTDFTVTTYRVAVSDYKEEMDPSDKYRFVRFLPEYAWMGWTDREIKKPMNIVKKKSSFSMKNLTRISRGKTSVYIGYYPDSRRINRRVYPPPVY